MIFENRISFYRKKIIQAQIGFGKTMYLHSVFLEKSPIRDFIANRSRADNSPGWRAKKKIQKSQN